MGKSNKGNASGGFTGKLGKANLLAGKPSHSLLASATSKALGVNEHTPNPFFSPEQIAATRATFVAIEKDAEIYDKEHEKTDAALRHLTAIHYLLPFAIQTYAKIRHEHDVMAHEENMPEGHDSKDPYGLRPLEIQTLDTMITPTSNGPVLDPEQFYRAGWDIVEIMRDQTKPLVNAYLKTKQDSPERAEALKAITQAFMQFDTDYKLNDVPLGQDGKYTVKQLEEQRTACENRALTVFIPLAEAIRNPDISGGNLIEALRKKTRGESLNAAETRAITGIGAVQSEIGQRIGIEQNTNASQPASDLFNKIINLSTNCGLTRLLAPCDLIRDGLVRGLGEYTRALHPAAEYRNDWQYIGQQYAGAQNHFNKILPPIEFLISDLVDNKYTPGEIVITEESIKQLASLGGYLDRKISDFKSSWNSKSDAAILPSETSFKNALDGLRIWANRGPEFQEESELARSLLINCPRSPGAGEQYKNSVKGYVNAVNTLKAKYTDICRKAKEERPKDVNRLDDEKALQVRRDIEKLYPGIKQPRLDQLVGNELVVYQKETDNLLKGKVSFSIKDAEVAEVYCAVSEIGSRLKSMSYCRGIVDRIEGQIMQLPEPRSPETEAAIKLAKTYTSNMLKETEDLRTHVDKSQKAIFERTDDPDVTLKRSQQTVELDKAYILFTRMKEPLKRLIDWAELHQPPGARPLMKVMEYAKREAAESAAATGAGSQAKK